MTGIAIPAVLAILSGGGLSSGEEKPSYAGTFKDEKLTVELTQVGGAYTGSIRLGNQTFPVKAWDSGRSLEGTFESGGDSFPSGYNEGWVNGKGEYIISNNPNFNPNVELGGDWQELKKR